MKKVTYKFEKFTLDCVNAQMAYYDKRQLIAKKDHINLLYNRLFTDSLGINIENMFVNKYKYSEWKKEIAF